MTRVAVAGGTGEVGSRVIARGLARGLDMVPLSRACGVDLMAAAGLAERLREVEVVIDCLSIATLRRRPAERFFTTTTANLLAAGAAAGVSRHLALSIVGIDKVPSPYYRAKVAQERVITDSAVPWTVLRATQFHEFAAQMVQRSSVGPFVLTPRMLCAPVAADEVADALLDLAVAEPSHGIVELGGPERIQLVDMVRDLVAATGARQRVVPVPLPGAARAARAGALCPDAPFRTGTLTFAEWLAAQAR